MADLKISALPSATLPLAGTETIPLVQGGVTSKALASDLFQWPTGRVTYVPIGGNIQAYVTAATAGDTLILGAGTYTVTATITVDKAILIKGQGLSATKVVTSTADLAVFTLAASTARVSDLYVGNTGTGTSFAFYAGDGLTQLQISNVVAVLGGNGLKYGIWSQSSITISNCEMYITSANLNSNGVMIYNETGATANINANIQNVRVLSTGATLNNRGIVFNNNNVANTIAGNVTNCNLTAYASTGVTDIALYVNSTTTNNVTVNAYNSLFDGADSDVTVIGTNSCTLSNCTLTHGTATGTVVYAGTQVVAKLNGNTITAGTGVLTLAAGKTLTASNTLTLAGTDATTQTFPTTSATIARTDAAQTFTGVQTFNTLLPGGYGINSNSTFTWDVTKAYYYNQYNGGAATVTLPAAATYIGLSLTVQNYVNQSLVSAASNIVDLGGIVSTAILPGLLGAWVVITSDGTYWRVTNSATNGNPGVFGVLNASDTVTFTKTGADQLALTGANTAETRIKVIRGTDDSTQSTKYGYSAQITERTGAALASVQGYSFIFRGTTDATPLALTYNSVNVTGTFGATGVVTFSNYTAGTATFSAAGVISSVSDETWKIKDGIPTDPDAMLKKLQPGYWYYNAEKAPIYGGDRQLGFFAQNVNVAIGAEAAPEPEEGKPWGYYDRSVLAVTVMSLQKALKTIEILTSRITALESK
jgi:hypothetical protein